MSGRPSIPSELRRKILVEAGHRCAIPTCRSLVVDVHHIVPWSKVKKHQYENLIALCPNCHRMAGKGEIDRKSLYMYKDNLRYVIEKYSKFELDVLLELSRQHKEAWIPLPAYLALLIRRILEEGFVELRERPGVRVKVAGVDTTPKALIITNKGREFVNQLSGKKIGYERS